MFFIFLHTQSRIFMDEGCICECARVYTVEWPGWLVHAGMRRAWQFEVSSGENDNNHDCVFWITDLPARTRAPEQGNARPTA
jgi:hypothetical protein